MTCPKGHTCRVMGQDQTLGFLVLVAVPSRTQGQCWVHMVARGQCDMLVLQALPTAVTARLELSGRPPLWAPVLSCPPPSAPARASLPPFCPPLPGRSTDPACSSAATLPQPLAR